MLCLWFFSPDDHHTLPRFFFQFYTSTIGLCTVWTLTNHGLMSLTRGSIILKVMPAGTCITPAWGKQSCSALATRCPRQHRTNLRPSGIGDMCKLRFCCRSVWLMIPSLQVSWILWWGWPWLIKVYHRWGKPQHTFSLAGCIYILFLTLKTVLW